MLRHALCRNRAKADLLVRARGQRFKTSGSPQPQRQPPNISRNTGHSRPGRAINHPLRRPNFLQHLRVRTTPGGPKPKIENPTPNAENSSKLAHLLRRGPVATEKGGTSSPKPQSATQSNMQGSTKPNTGVASSPGLVQFFQERLKEVKASSQAKEGNVGNQEGEQDGSRPALQGRGFGYPRLQTHRPGPNRHPAANINLEGAMKEVRMAQRSMDTPPEELTTIRQVLDQSKVAGIATRSENETAKKSTTMSPIRQYVHELRKKNQQKRADQFAQEGRENSVPSWRKSAKTSSFNQRMRFQQQQEVMAGRKIEEMSVPDPFDQPVNPYAENWLEEKQQEEKAKAKAKAKAKVTAEVVLPNQDVSISDLSLLFRKKTAEIMECLQGMGESPNDDHNFKIDVDMAEMVALELDIKFTRPKRRATTKVDNDHDQLMNRRKAGDESEAEAEATEGTKYESLAPRPPVVCIMGHVDHGKTTLMDSLRRRSQGGGKQKKKSKKSKNAGKKATTSKGGDIAGTEAGGITQIISAFQVPLGDQKDVKDAITFLDTPGHAAFSAMRQSGSHAADIIVLVIAADDGVSPQTVEILNFYKSIVKESGGGISMVVAMNKIDKPGVDVEESKRRIENQLLEHGIVSEGISSESEYGSPVQFIPISAKIGAGLDDLIEGLVLQSEVMDLRADDSARAEGIVMDARVEQGLGVVADCIVRWGCIEKGDIVVSNTSAGKVRILKDVNDKPLKKGLPSQPVRLVGFKTPPKAGDPILCVASEQVADDLVERRLAVRDKSRAKVSADPNSPFSQVIVTGPESKTSALTERRMERYELDLEDTGPIRIPIVVKAKADGSVAAVRDSLKMLAEESSFDINVDAIAEGVGVLTAGEIETAKESNAAVFCFDIKNQDKGVVALAESEGVAIHDFDVIYSLLDHAKEVFTDYLPLTPVETVHGKATVQAVFSINNDKDKIAGLKVLDGHLHKSFADADKLAPVKFRVIRDGEMVTPEGEEARATSLKKFKDDVESVKHGDECGLSLSSAVDFQEGDTIECYSIEMRKSFTR